MYIQSVEIVCFLIHWVPLMCCDEVLAMKELDHCFFHQTLFTPLCFELTSFY
jgi:hypothetical protein